MNQRTSATMAAALLMVAVSSAQGRSDVVYPDHPNVVVVTRAPYFVKGDGMTDDSDAFQQAINEHTGQGRILSFPPGPYLVRKTLTWPKRWKDRENWGGTTLQGRAAKKCTIRLKDGAFTDAQRPQAIMTTTRGKLAPMFVIDDSSLFLFFGEVCYTGDPFETLVRETRGGETRLLHRRDGNTIPYVGFDGTEIQ
jgi:hypothetical protein